MRVLAGLLVLLLLGLVAPHAASEYTLRLLGLAAIAAVAVLGLNFAFGLAGLISLGHAAFAGVGAYCYAILTTSLGWRPWLAVPPALLCSGGLAAVLGFPLLRLKGHYLALATLGLNVSATLVASNWLALTGGTNGIGAIPPLPFGTLDVASERGFLPFALGIVAIAGVAATVVARSRHGLAMVAVRDDETAARMTGIDARATKVAAFVLSGVYAGVAGVLFASHVNFVSPDDFSYGHSITYLAMLIVGGEGSVAGAVIGAGLLTFLPEWLRVLGEGYLAFFGLLVLAVLVLLPSGVVGVLRRAAWRRPVAATALP